MYSNTNINDKKREREDSVPHHCKPNFISMVEVKLLEHTVASLQGLFLHFISYINI